MEDKNEQFINPDSWTEKELLKHLYREVREIKQNMVGWESSIQNLQKELKEVKEKVDKERTIRETREDDINKRINRNNTVAAVIGTIIAALALWSSLGNGI